MKHVYIYKVSVGYKRCDVWTGEGKSHYLIGRSTLTPDEGLTRKERHAVIADWLVERFSLRRPEYEPTAKEA